MSTWRCAWCGGGGGGGVVTQAEAFRGKLPRINRAYGSYAELAQDPEVDVVYIGTVHSCHKVHALMMIEAGKHVLCEKPITLNMKHTKVLIAAARARKVFFLEGQ
jgi:dihydrodiol dehydrogenase / D-xylose 1-dehydrogenase (NADP)